MNNIILIGYMGSGKTTIGKRLADVMQQSFYDTDEMIEQQTNLKISDIFANHGEAYFREMETHTLEKLQNNLNHVVLSTGGGMPCSEINASLLKSLGTVIYLQVSKEVVVQRLQGDRTRPLLQGEDFEKKVETMLQIRHPLYEKAADIVIATDQLSVDEIVKEILKKKK